MRSRFYIFKTASIAVFLLAAILSGALSFALFSPGKSSTAEMVYCPLTRKLQPANPPKIAAPVLSVGEICARDFQKNIFALAVLRSAKFQAAQINQADFENLVFDFWRDGQAALDALPNAPSNAPEKLTAKNSFAATGFGGDYESRLVWQTAEVFTFQLKPRPPTNQNSSEFKSNFVRKLNRISRRISPRAPPVLV